MLKLLVRGSLLKFDAQTAQKDIRKAVQNRMRLAAAAFIRASVPHVPVDTGMARGSFLNLARALTRAGFPVSVDINPVRVGTRKKPIWYYSEKGERLPKRPTTGASLSEYAFYSKGDKYTFDFETNVWHYAIMDFYNVKGNGPWESFKIGREAFLSVMQGLKDDIPNLEKYITKTTVRSGSARSTAQETVNGSGN